MIEYDGYEFESPVDRAKIERLADICVISCRAAAAKYKPFPECLGELASCMAALVTLAGPLFPPRGGLVPSVSMAEGGCVVPVNKAPGGSENVVVNIVGLASNQKDDQVAKPSK